MRWCKPTLPATSSKPKVLASDPNRAHTSDYAFETGQTVIFLGDHTTPDDPGFVRIVRDVLARFHPQLNLHLISAGTKGQTAHGLRSQALMDILLSSRPNWLGLSLGFGDALREPDARVRYEEYLRRKADSDEGPDAAIGPEYRISPLNLGPVEDVGKEPEPQLERLGGFKGDLQGAVSTLLGAGIRPILLTTVVLGSDLSNPLNVTLRAYSRVIREIAAEQGCPLVDVERAFRDVVDRARNYKQSVTLTAPDGSLNPQGEALIARNFLHTFGLLPGPGFRRAHNS